VQNRNKVRSTVVDEIVEFARGEADVLYIGRQKPLWTTVRNDPIRLGVSISPTTVAYAGTPSSPTTMSWPTSTASPSAQRSCSQAHATAEGLRIATIGGCHDCHTDGFAASGGASRS